MKIGLWLLSAIVVFFSNQAFTATWLFTGNITSIDTGLVTNMHTGDTFTVRVDFDPNTNDLYEFNPPRSQEELRGRYEAEWITLTSANFQATNLGPVNYAPDIIVSDNFNQSGWDELAINSGLQRHNSIQQGDRDLVSITLGLRDTDATVFGSDRLPLPLPNFSEFELNEFSMLFSNDYTAGIVAFDAKWVSGSITSISEVPIPATAWFFGSALLGLLGKKRFAKM